MKIVEKLRKRRQEARAQGRLIHPEPIIAEIRKRRKKLLRSNSLIAIVISRSGDFVEDVVRNIRNMNVWENAIVGITINKIIQYIISK